MTGSFNSIMYPNQLSMLPAYLACVFFICSALRSTAEEEVVFSDQFAGELAEGWDWLREHAAYWCIRDEALEIRVVPGLAGTVKNALVRNAPDRTTGTFRIEVEVTNLSEPTQQYEQAGLTLYQNGKPVFKFVKELVDGKIMMIPGRKIVTGKSVQLRLIVTADSYTAQFKTDEQDEFQTASTGKIPPPDDDQISIQCYNGPPDQEHWIRFDNFRIVKLKD